MTGLEAAATAVGKAVAGRAAREWLAARADKADLGKDLTELMRVSLPDRFARRNLDRKIDTIADAVEKRLDALVRQEYRDLADNDREAVLLEVESALRRADLSDRALFDADADPVKLARRVRKLMPASAAQLGEAGARLYDVLLEECCDCLVRIVLGLPEFEPRALAETLARLSSLGDQVSAVLGRLPAKSLDAPEGTQDDHEFERRYLEHLANTLDEIELFGVHVDAGKRRPRATLSVAYINLTVRNEDPRRGRDAGPLKIEEFAGDPRREREPATMKAEAMLARSPRTLLRGHAGSGKTTLLNWITVTAARRAFTGPLAEWNGRIPFRITLRSHADGVLPEPADFVTGPLGSIMPKAWVHRVLRSGRGILLVDGVDEVPAEHREAVQRWLRDLLTAYPKVRTVVTSRPTAVDYRWLDREGFRPVILEPMTPENLRDLVRNWHLAVRDAGTHSCPAEKLPEYENHLLARLQAGSHLRALAATPLLAAMLCALNLGQEQRLPRNRMELYRDVLDMLLERRDADRRVRSHPGIELERAQKERLLQELAWRLTFIGSEMSETTALRRIGERLEGMPRVTASPAEILAYLTERSGVLRVPVPGRIDFVHRSIQEYLAACRAAYDEDVGTLLKRAHLDQWRETVVMAAGHANARMRRDLLNGLLDRAEKEPRRAHRLRMLVAACTETVLDMPEPPRTRIDGCVSSLIPPRSITDVRQLAAMGEEVLRRLPESLEGLSEARAVATVRTVWMINGPKAMDVLARYASDPRPKVQRELVTAWDYFEPHAYAKRVLAEAPLDHGRLFVRSPALLPAVRSLQRLRRLEVSLFPSNTGLECIRGLPALSSLRVSGVRPETLPMLAEHPTLEDVMLVINGVLEDPSPLLALPALRFVNINPDRFASGLGFVARLPPLKYLIIRQIDSTITDFAPLAEQRGLELLFIDCPGLADVSVLTPLGELKSLLLNGARLRGATARIAQMFPRLRTLYLEDNEWLDNVEGISTLPLHTLGFQGCSRLSDLRPIATLRNLEFLTLEGVPFDNLDPISGFTELKYLDLGGRERPLDLAPLADLGKLDDLWLREIAEPVDLTPLAGLRGLTIHMNEGQVARGADRLDRTSRINWWQRA